MKNGRTLKNQINLLNQNLGMAAKFGGDAVSYAGVNPFSYFETSQK
jgi:hypothetical protein